MNKNQLGITLIELMIVVAIVGILASFAYPFYQKQVLEGRRSEARTALLGLAQAQERFYTLNGSYATSVAGLSGVPATTENGYYTLTTTGGTTFTGTATPNGTDAECATLTINHQGVKAGTGTNSSQCW